MLRAVVERGVGVNARRHVGQELEGDGVDAGVADDASQRLVAPIKGTHEGNDFAVGVAVHKDDALVPCAIVYEQVVDEDGVVNHRQVGIGQRCQGRVAIINPIHFGIQVLHLGAAGAHLALGSCTIAHHDAVPVVVAILIRIAQLCILVVAHHRAVGIGEVAQPIGRCLPARRRCVGHKVVFVWVHVCALRVACEYRHGIGNRQSPADDGVVERCQTELKRDQCLLAERTDALHLDGLEGCPLIDAIGLIVRRCGAKAIVRAEPANVFAVVRNSTCNVIDADGGRYLSVTVWHVYPSFLINCPFALRLRG